MPVATECMHHISFAVPELRPALTFYRDLLGFVEVPRPPLDFEGAWLNKGGLEIHLIVPKAGVETASPASKANPYLSHVAFKVSDLDAARRDLENAGLSPIVQEGAVRQMWVLDPGGNMIEFIQTPRVASTM
jgi:catechol 2,3-dioxygenase-like lactoylglutathione lyase family enzyme